MKKCKYCDYEEGAICTTPLARKVVKIGVLGEILTDVSIGDTSDGIVLFVTTGIFPGNEDFICKKLKIKYCPMCGRKFSKEG